VAEQMTAEELGIPYQQVVARPVDTRLSPNGGVTCASRMTYLVGNSLLLAAVQLKNNLLKETAALLKLPVSSLRYAAGEIHLADGKKVAVAEVTSRLAEQGMRVQAEATATFEYPLEKTPQQYPIGIPHIMFVFGAQVVRVEVDEELGTVEVREITAIHDVGKAINRAAVEGQIEGAIAQGLGYGLYEDMQLKGNGEWVDSFSEYLIPTALEMPHIECIILEQPEASGPYGAKGVGEMGLVPTAPAITNAIFDAVGVRLVRIPVTPEALLKLA
jgi:CO/xanthine dehydrogenase Mo-binding subunit